MRDFRNIYSIPSKFQNYEFQLHTNDIKQRFKINKMIIDENLMLCSGVMTRFFHSIMKVDISNKLMVDVEVIVSWVDENVFKKYIGEAYGIDILTGIWGYEKRLFIEDMK